MRSVTVLLFASYADALGRGALTLAFDGPASVADVVARVRAMPGAQSVPPGPLVAVNQTYAAAEHALADGDEVAILPPVAGG